jgi:hypothetical protein
VVETPTVDYDRPTGGTMAGIAPEGENLRNAVKWISQQRQDRPDVNLATLVDEASVRFDLSPRDQDFLWRALKEASQTQGDD